MNAPIVIFCYTRLDLLKKTVAALLKNKEAAETEVFFYSDGGKDEKSWRKVCAVRRYLCRLSGFKSVTVIEQKENKRLEFNVIQGITEVVEKYDRVIVLEDDIVVSKKFLSFMNQALETYNNHKNVMAIAGFNPCKFSESFPDTFCMRLIMGWGWATWKDRWAKFKYFEAPDAALQLLSEKDKCNIEFDGAFPCLKTLHMTPVPWDICWYISIYIANGVCLFPKQSLTYHIGKNGSHFSRSPLGQLLYHVPFENTKICKKNNLAFTKNIERNIEAEQIFQSYLFNFEYNTFLAKLIKKIVRLMFPYRYEIIRGHILAFLKRHNFDS